MSRTIGRRKTDRYRVSGGWTLAAGLALGAVLVTYGLYTTGCDASGPTKVDPIVAQPAEVVAKPDPAPTATPAVIGGPTKALDLACLSGASMIATYNGQASFAEIETWYTGFDDQNPQPRPGLQTAIVATGNTVTRTFNPCNQGDAAIKGGKESGCFWDKNGNPFTPNTPAGNKATEECRYVPPSCETTTVPELEITGAPAAGTNSFTGIGTVLPLGGSWSIEGFPASPVTVDAEHTSLELVYSFTQVYGGELRCTRKLAKTFTLTYNCVPTWNADGSETIYGEWSEILTGEAGCYQKRTKTKVYYEINSCTQARREKSRVEQGFDLRRAECLCVETWIELDPIVVISPWSACVLGDQTRTVQTVIGETNSCTQDQRTKSDVTITEHQECQTPGHCYYKIAGDSEEAKEVVCESGPIGGTWLNFGAGALSNHCDIAFPGISLKGFNLTKGQSAEGCLDKH